MTIRLARPQADEAAAFATLHVACWKEAYRGLVPDAILDAAGTATRLAAWQAALADATRIVIGAYDADTPVGFVMGGAATEKLFDGIDGHVQALYIRASHYRLGLGRRLMGPAAQSWIASGGRSLAVGVLAGNGPARRFYEALGGRLVRTGLYVWDGHPLEDAVYVFEDLEKLAAAA